MAHRTDRGIATRPSNPPVMRSLSGIKVHGPEGSFFLSALRWFLERSRGRDGTATCEIQHEGATALKHPAAASEQRQDAASSMNWQQMVETGRIHGVLPLLSLFCALPPPFNLPESSGEPRGAFRERCPLALLQSEARESAIMNLAFQLALREMGEIFHQAEIPLILLKGGAYSLSLYPSPELRPMEDLDLLVRGEDFPRAQRLLRGIGYRGVESGEWNYLSRSSPPVMVDLHTSLWPLEVKEVWERATLLALPASRQCGPGSLRESFAPGSSGVTLQALSLEDALLYEILHGSVWHGFFLLIWLLDCALVIRDPAFSWDTFSLLFSKTRKRVPGIILPVSIILGVLREHLGVDLPPQIVQEMGIKGGWKGALFEKILSSPPVYNMGHLLLFISLSWKERLFHLWKILFPPRSFIERRYGKGHTWLKQIIRPFLLFLEGCRLMVSAWRKVAPVDSSPPT